MDFFNTLNPALLFGAILFVLSFVAFRLSTFIARKQQGETDKMIRGLWFLARAGVFLVGVGSLAYGLWLFIPVLNDWWGIVADWVYGK